MWIISVPLLASQYPALLASMGLLDYRGSAWWGYGFLFKMLGDQQLALFKSHPANMGRLLDKDVWRFIRHPNYFEMPLSGGGITW